jgi:hypothetical protein
LTRAASVLVSVSVSTSAQSPIFSS